MAWDQFVAIYQPLVFRLARSKGFQDSDAHDIVQEVLLAVSKAIQRWDPDRGKGRFRDWLFRIARNMMLNFLTRRKHQSLGSPECVADLLEAYPDGRTLDADVTQEFDWEFRRELFWLAADKVRSQVKSNTWEAFRLTAMLGLSTGQTAQQLAMKEGAVLVARCRVLARLRAVVAELESPDTLGTPSNWERGVPHE